MQMAEFPKTITVPSGLAVTITRKMKTRDTIMARRVVDKADADNPEARAIAAIAGTLEINGKPAVYEDLLDLDLEDIEAIVAEIGIEKKKDSPTS
jgi:hypothetical protein